MTIDGGERDADEIEAEVAAATGILLVFYLLVSVVVGFFPCIVFCVAHQQCIAPHQERGEQPTCCAWTTCVLIFAVTVLTSLGVGIPWLILPFFMIIPFCMGESYNHIPQAHALPSDPSIHPRHILFPNVLTIWVDPAADSCYEGNGRQQPQPTIITQTQSPVAQTQMHPIQQLPQCVAQR